MRTFINGKGIFFPGELIDISYYGFPVGEVMTETEVDMMELIGISTDKYYVYCWIGVKNGRKVTKEGYGKDFNGYAFPVVKRLQHPPLPEQKTNTTLTCPRVGCPNYVGNDILSGKSFSSDNSCPKCGFPGFIPKTGWCKHRNLRVGYDSHIHCLTDGCDAKWKLSASKYNISLKANMRLAKLEAKIHNLPSCGENDFLAQVSLHEKLDNITSVLILQPLNDEAKAPPEGWPWSSWNK